MKCVAEIQAGVCGFKTTITAEAEEEMVSFALATDCQKIQGLGSALHGRSFDAYSEIHTGFDGGVMQTVRANLSGCCAGCVVPVGIFKSMQVAARVALPKEVMVYLEVEE